MINKFHHQTSCNPNLWKIGQTECQLVVDTGAEVSVCTKLMADLLKLKLKLDKTIIIVAIDGVK